MVFNAKRYEKCATKGKPCRVGGHKSLKAANEAQPRNCQKVRAKGGHATKKNFSATGYTYHRPHTGKVTGGR